MVFSNVWSSWQNGETILIFYVTSLFIYSSQNLYYHKTFVFCLLSTTKTSHQLFNWLRWNSVQVFMFNYKINPDYFGEALTFHLASSGENISWSSTLVCESIPAELLSFPSASDVHMLNQRWVNMILNIMVTLYLLNSMLALSLWAFSMQLKAPLWFNLTELLACLLSLTLVTSEFVSPAGCRRPGCCWLHRKLASEDNKDLLTWLDLTVTHSLN